MIQPGKKKIGRNDPCPCGSGVKFNKCHGRLSLRSVDPAPAQIKLCAMLESHEAKEARRQYQRGQGKPIISTEFQGYRFTAVGNRCESAWNNDPPLAVICIEN